MTIKHSFVSQKTDGTDTTLVRPSNWNADHVVTGYVPAIVVTDAPYNAKGDGVTDDTAAFQAAVNAVGTSGTVIAPGGKTYSLSGLLINRSYVTLEIWGDVVVPPGSGTNQNVGIIIDDTTGASDGVISNEIVIHGKLSGKEGVARPNTNNHLCVGIQLRFAEQNRIEINQASNLTNAVALRPDLNSAAASRSCDHSININFATNCYATLYSKAGPAPANHTQGTIVRGAFWALYGYGIFKDQSNGGDQHYWDVSGIAMDGFSNPDLVATISDDQGQSYYRLSFDDGLFIGNAFVELPGVGATDLVTNVSVVTGRSYTFNRGVIIKAINDSFPDGWGSNLKLIDSDFPAIWLKGTAADDGLIIGGDSTLPSLQFGWEQSGSPNAVYFIIDFSTNSFRPSTAAAGLIDLGTATRQWRTGYFAGSVFAYNATAVPAGGSTGKGFLLSSTANFGIFFGSGAPSLSAAKGSLYLRSDGTGTTDRAFINTNGATTWTALTTVA